MKKWVCMVAAVVLMLSSVGCTRDKPDETVTDGFTCRVAAAYREMNVEGDLQCAEDGDLTLTFTLPKSLKGVTLGWDGDQITMALGDMQMDVPADTVPQSALIRCLSQVLAAPHGAGTETDSGYVVKGEVEGTAYTITFDSATGLPRSLSVPDEELEATFADCTRLTDE